MKFIKRNGLYVPKKKSEHCMGCMGIEEYPVFRKISGAEQIRRGILTPASSGSMGGGAPVVAAAGAWYYAWRSGDPVTNPAIFSTEGNGSLSSHGFGCKIKVGQSGTITQISVKTKAFTGTLRAGVYTKPDNFALDDCGTAIVNPSVNGWNDTPISGSAVTSGDTIYAWFGATIDAYYYYSSAADGGWWKSGLDWSAGCPATILDDVPDADYAIRVWVE